MAKIGKKVKERKVIPWTPRPEVLLDPPIPVPLSGTAPRVVMGQAWWDEVRGEARLSTNFHCIACKVQAGPLVILEGHERYEIDWLLGVATYLETVPLCPQCHAFIHPGFLMSQVDAWIISRQEAEDVLERGRGVLREAGLSRPDDKINRAWSSVEWSDWRLIVEGREYPPLYDSLEDFRKAMKEG